ncbi:UvrB/UvrC motif-containing protein [Proteiniborus sp.]|uniref:UvrB/UvrC motif-containing protein n=1 Tax=Proteiniborus sp. TaxID=2079015 RepID=UPI0033262590
MDFKKKVKNLPSTPGVYLMKNFSGDIIYVGKSKSLKNRVSSYFQNSRNHPPKVERLVKTIKDFDYILTDTEFEAFILECKLIKDIKPIYNKQMKTPSSYIYIGINTDEENTGIKIENNINEKNSSIYFGPYTNRNTVERAIKGIKEFCKIDCNSTSKKKAPCLNYSLGLCIGMCLGGTAAKEYDKIIDRIVELLNGTDMSILEEMKQKMQKTSENFDFEVAAKYRDYVIAIKTLISKEKVIEFTEDNKNIAVIEHLNNSNVKLFLIKGNKVLFNEKYKLDNLSMEQTQIQLKSNILNCFKDNELSLTIEIKKEDIDEAQIIYSYLKSNNCNYIIIPDEWLDSRNYDHIDQALLNLLSF